MRWIKATLLLCVLIPLASAAFNVTWYEVSNSLADHVYEISVQNLNPSAQQRFDLSALFSNTSFIPVGNITDVILHEWKMGNRTHDVYNSTIVYKNYFPGIGELPANCWDDPLNQSQYACNESYVSGQTSFVTCYWKPSKMSLFSFQNSRKANQGNIMIPKLGSKAKVDELGEVESINGTKLFRLSFNAPIIESENYGSTGEVGIIDENTNAYYHPWWNSSWSYCKDITVVNGNGALYEFPVYFNVSDVVGIMQDDYDDLRFISEPCGENGYELDYEVESSTATNAYVWVRMNLSAGNTTIGMYYGNSAAASGQNTYNVWSPGFFTGVWHMGEPDAIDSAGGDNNGTNGGNVTSVDGSLALVGTKANYFSGNDSTSQIRVATTDNLQNGTLTANFWWRPYETRVHHIFDHQYAYKPGFQVLFPNNYYRASVGNATNSTYRDYAMVQNNNEWHHFAMTYNSSGVLNMYIAGQLVSFTQTNLGDLADGYNHYFFFGRRMGASYFWLNGSIDEFRVSEVARTPDWINASYQLIANYSKFVFFGLEQEPPVLDYIGLNYSFHAVGLGMEIWPQINGSDPDIGDYLTGYYDLYRNGTYNFTNKSIHTFAGGGVFNVSEPVISKGYLSEGDNWTVAGIITDNTDGLNSTEYLNFSVYIYGYPNATSVTINGTITEEDNDMLFTATATGAKEYYFDLFNHDIYQTTLFSTTNTAHWLSGNLTLGDNWTVALIVSNGGFNSTEYPNASREITKYAGINRTAYSKEVIYGEDFTYLARHISGQSNKKCSYYVLGTDDNVESIYPFTEYATTNEPNPVMAPRPQGYSILTGGNGTIAVTLNTHGFEIRNYTFRMLCEPITGYSDMPSLDEVTFGVVYSIEGEAPQRIATAALANIGNLGVIFLFFVGFIGISAVLIKVFNMRDYL